MSSQQTLPLQLYGWSHSRISLDAAAHAVFGESGGTVGILLYSPNQCLCGIVVVDLDRGALVNDGSSDCAIEALLAFEARLFDGQKELRWVRHSAEDADIGHAVVTSEVHNDDPAGWDALVPIKVVDWLDTPQLLWGTAELSKEGIIELREARISALRIPGTLVADAIADGDRIEILSREYIAVEPNHGNAYVADERLIGFAVHGAPPSEEEEDVS